MIFLDELPEFRRDLLEALQEPLETGEVRVSRSKRKVIWKSRVVLIAACNNCPCGWAGSSRRGCDCPTSKTRAYNLRLSGPLLDRIDIHLNMPEADEKTADLFLRLMRESESSQTERMAAKVLAARRFARERNQAFGVEFNRDLQTGHLIAASGMATAAFATLVNKQIPKLASARAVVRCLRVARTLADLEGRSAIEAADIRLSWAWRSDKAAEERGLQVYDQVLPPLPSKQD